MTTLKGATINIVVTICEVEGEYVGERVTECGIVTIARSYRVNAWHRTRLLGQRDRQVSLPTATPPRSLRKAFLLTSRMLGR